MNTREKEPTERRTEEEKENQERKICMNNNKIW